MVSAVCLGRLLAAVLLTVTCLPSSFGEGMSGDVVSADTSAPAGPTAESDCTGPPDGARPLEYRIIRIREDPLPRRRAHVVAVDMDGQQILDEAEYVRLFGEPSVDIDWTASRILGVRLTTTYKHNALESGEVLSGIYQDAHGIHVGRTFTVYGPCQGVAQQEEWFTYAFTDVFVLLPVEPAGIGFYYCIVGGCPPDIP